MSRQTDILQKPDSGSDQSATSKDRKLRLLVSCPDRKGLVAAVSSCFEKHQGNILRIDQYRQPGHEVRFFMRMEVEEAGFDLGPDEFAQEFVPLARKYDMDWRLSYSGLEVRPLPRGSALAVECRGARSRYTTDHLQPSRSRLTG